MEMNFQNNISNTAAETDIVKNSIIWQCLYALKTVSEFQNLTYRVTKTWNDMEMVAVYRKGVLGIFGPPVDPITLMLDQKGKCLLSIPFTPVQRVSIVSPEYGHVEISSLLAILRMIAGNGYLFCPGLPERFLIGKACAKFVVLHKVPFKRYQSPQCPVYYQAQVHQQKSAKSSLCAMCPRCMEAAKWIQSLPVCNPKGTGKAAQLSHPQADQKNVVLGASMAQEIKDYAAVPSARLSYTPSFNNSPTISPFVGSQYLNSPLGKNTLGEKASNLDVNGNSQTVDALKDSRCASGKNLQAEDIKPSVSNKILETKSFLRNLLQKTSTKKMDTSDHCAETKDFKNSNKDTSMPVKNNKLKKFNKRHKNVCRHCKKEFSTPANLMNHFQRHEALSGSWCKQFKERKLLRSSSFYPKVVSRLGSKLSFLQGKKPAHLSETTIRLFLKYLNDLILSHKETKCSAQAEYTAVGHKGMNNEVEKHTELNLKNKLERPHSLLYEQTEHKALEKRYRRKRTESGLSPMQTLLKAAVIADVDSDVTSPTISSSSSLALGRHHEIAVVSSTTQSPTNKQKESIIPQKKARKSERLETKKRKSRGRKSGVICDETAEMRSVATSDSHTPLTNLDLLSSVSIKTAMRETQASTQSSITVSHSIPTSFSSNIRTRAANHSPTSDCVSNNQKFLDTSHNSFMVTGSQRKEPFTNMNVSSCSDLSTLPHLLHGANSAYPFLTLKQHAQLQSVSPTSSSSLMATGGHNQATSESSVMASKMDESPSNGCGAMDLSKPKTPHMFANIQSMAESRHNLSAMPISANIQSMAESRHNLSALSVSANIQSMAESKHNLSSLPNLPHNIAQLVTSSSPAVLQYLMMSKNVDLNSTAYKDLDPHSSNKQADHGLHPSLLAGAPNYNIDRGGKNVAQVQSVVATTSGSTMPGKVKPGASLAGQGDEIQCGYKWTGSGGLVKERTQIVRELVPSHVMANFLSKPWAPATATQPISNNLSSNSLPPILSPQAYSSSKYTHPAQKKHQNMPTPQHALNLTMSKSPEFLSRGDSGVPQKSSQLVLTSTSSPVYQSTAVSSVSTGISMLQPSTSYSSGTVSKHAPNIPAPTDIRAHSTTSNLKKKRLRTTHPPEFTGHLSSSHPTAMTTFSSSTISSPSLAAMLLQPALQEHATVHNDTPEHTHHTVTAPKMLNNRNNTGDGYVSFSPASSYVKTEPVDSHHTSEQDVTLMILPIKCERWNPDTIDSSARANDDRSPPNLVMAMSPESLTKKDQGKALNLGTRPISRAADFVS